MKVECSKTHDDTGSDCLIWPRNASVWLFVQLQK